ncbi:hypothetical protein LTR37_000507 [Vermiconidia calcicola]|uniref:Uncharacterized protein n=1 Tax=Vermiconidia calcicola TaxID=1690605 RepID=A0ACC3P0F1_9PEZI|nr:hypothetical protein LTR37_000507 [Vermiconidia calcicola]
MEDEPKERRFLIRRPKALQYFHNGQFKKAAEKERVAGRFELFFDLLYVALIANFAEALTEHPSGTQLVIFILTFTPAWHAWADAKEHANNYYNDDLLQRCYILWIMALLILYGNNANFVRESLNAQRVTVAAYQCIRFTQLSFFLLYSVASHHHRTQNRVYAGLTFLGLLIWVPIYFEGVSDGAMVGVAFAAIVWEELAYVLGFSPIVAKMMNLEFTTAVDIEHEDDRYTAFTIIVLGEFTYSILVGSPAHGGLNAGILRAVWTLVIAFCFNSMYVYTDGAIDNDHPIRHSVHTAFPWFLIHLPMSAGLLIGGHVSAIATYEDLHTGHRWLWGGGLGVGVSGMWIIAQLFKDCDPPGKLLLPKQLRLLPRLLAAIIYVLLPLASHHELSTTSLISIGAGISGFVVIWETITGLERNAGIIESWSGKAETYGTVVDVSSRRMRTTLEANLLSGDE